MGQKRTVSPILSADNDADAVHSTEGVGVGVIDADCSIDFRLVDDRVVDPVATLRLVDIEVSDTVTEVSDTVKELVADAVLLCTELVLLVVRPEAMQATAKTQIQIRIVFIVCCRPNSKRWRDKVSSPSCATTGQQRQRFVHDNFHKTALPCKTFRAT